MTDSLTTNMDPKLPPSLGSLHQPSRQLQPSQSRSEAQDPVNVTAPFPHVALPNRYPSRLHDITSTVTGTRPAIYLRRAAVAAWFPLKGIWYFCRTSAFWPLFAGRLLPLSFISFFVYFILFAVAFVPQFAFLAIFHGWGAWINAVVLVLGEGLVIIQGLFEGFFVDECRVDAFDATLLDHDLVALVAPHRILHPDAPNSVKRLGKPTTSAIFQPWSMIQILELAVFLPLNLIPYVGTPAFILITGSRLGKLCHHRWFALRGLTKTERKDEINLREWDYMWFGAVAMILELIPVLSLFFLLTTAVGAGLWTAALEAEAVRRHRLAVIEGDSDLGAEHGATLGSSSSDLTVGYRDDPV